MSIVRSILELVDDETHGGTTSHPLRYSLKVGNPHLSSSSLEHESASFMRSQSLGLFILIDDSLILFHAAVAKIQSGHAHSSVEKLHNLVNFTGRRTIKDYLKELVTYPSVATILVFLLLKSICIKTLSLLILLNSAESPMASSPYSSPSMTELSF